MGIKIQNFMPISKPSRKNAEKLLTKKLQAKKRRKVKLEGAFFPNYSNGFNISAKLGIFLICKKEETVF
jgi:hypothetical protein